MNYYITKLRLKLLDRLSELSIKISLWSTSESTMIRLGIHEVGVEDEEGKKSTEIKIIDMRKKWRDLSKRTEEILNEKRSDTRVRSYNE